MSEFKRITQLFETAEHIPIDDHSKIIFFSDCHRGNGGWGDDFSKNQNIYFVAMTNYFNKNYTYIELGDGDELWENKNLSDIKEEHSNVFWLLSNFYKEGRLYFIYGNHDMVKKNDDLLKELHSYYDVQEKRYLPLFSDIKMHEALVLEHKSSGGRILLIHGHQVDFLNNKLWKLACFLVRYLWHPLEMFGVNNPTSPAKSYDKKVLVSNKLASWTKKENTMMIAGHTHKAVFPEVDGLYFNDGSCVHPRCITGIEIANGNIMLIKWSVMTKEDGTLFVSREVLAGPRRLTDYFDKRIH